MRTFSQFVQLCEAIYDTDKPSDVPLEVGRISTTRKKTAPERRRTKRLCGGQVGPAKEYKPRSDIGTTSGIDQSTTTNTRTWFC